MISATVVMSTRKPGGCFGFLEMASSEDAAKTASTFDLTEFRGCVLHVELTDRKPPTQSTKSNLMRPKSMSYTSHHYNRRVPARNFDYRKRLAGRLLF